MASNLLQDVLRHTAQGHIDTNSHDKDDSDDELVNVVRPSCLVVIYRISSHTQFSLPGTPPRSRPSTRPPSPTRGALARFARGHLSATAAKQLSDPLRAFPTEISQRIFGLLGIRDLARCARVSRKWRKSQTLNYGVFSYYVINVSALTIVASLVSTL